MGNLPSGYLNEKMVRFARKDLDDIDSMVEIRSVDSADVGDLTGLADEPTDDHLVVALARATLPEERERLSRILDERLERWSSDLPSGEITSYLIQKGLVSLSISYAPDKVHHAVVKASASRGAGGLSSEVFELSPDKKRQLDLTKIETLKAVPCLSPVSSSLRLPELDQIQMNPIAFLSKIVPIVSYATQSYGTPAQFMDTFSMVSGMVANIFGAETVTHKILLLASKMPLHVVAACAAAVEGSGLLEGLGITFESTVAPFTEEKLALIREMTGEGGLDLETTVGRIVGAFIVDLEGDALLAFEDLVEIVKEEIRFERELDEILTLGV